MSLFLVSTRACQRRPWFATIFKLSVIYVVAFRVILISNCIVDFLYMWFCDSQATGYLWLLPGCPRAYYFNWLNERTSWMLTG